MFESSVITSSFRAGGRAGPASHRWSRTSSIVDSFFPYGSNIFDLCLCALGSADPARHFGAARIGGCAVPIFSISQPKGYGGRNDSDSCLCSEHRRAGGQCRGVFSAKAPGGTLSSGHGAERSRNRCAAQSAAQLGGSLDVVSDCAQHADDVAACIRFHLCEGGGRVVGGAQFSGDDVLCVGHIAQGVDREGSLHEVRAFLIAAFHKGEACEFQVFGFKSGEGFSDRRHVGFLFMAVRGEGASYPRHTVGAALVSTGAAVTGVSEVQTLTPFISLRFQTLASENIDRSSMPFAPNLQAALSLCGDSDKREQGVCESPALSSLNFPFGVDGPRGHTGGAFLGVGV